MFAVRKISSLQMNLLNFRNSVEIFEIRNGRRTINFRVKRNMKGKFKRNDYETTVRQTGKGFGIFKNH